MKMLLGNHGVLTKSAGRQLAAATISGTRSSWQKSGALRGRHLGAFDIRAATPSAYGHPYTFVLPVKAGWVGSNTQVSGFGDLTGSGALGVAAIAALSGVGDLTVSGQLVVSAVATLSGVGDLTASGVGSLNAAATLAGTGDLVGSVKALAEVVAGLTGAGALAVGVQGPGSMSATLTVSNAEVLTAAAVAQAVWTSVASGFNDPGSMGAQLNFLYLLQNHKVVTNPSTGTMTVYDTDGTTVLFQANLFEDAAGTQAYRGQGAERRERLV